MVFDAGKVFEDMLTAAGSELSSDWSEVNSCVMQAFEGERQALEAIALARIAGEIDDDDMRSHLEDEEKVLKAALLSCKVRAKASAQRAVNAAMKVLNDAIRLALFPL